MPVASQLCWTFNIVHEFVLSKSMMPQQRYDATSIDFMSDACSTFQDSMRVLHNLEVVNRVWLRRWRRWLKSLAVPRLLEHLEGDADQGAAVALHRGLRDQVDPLARQPCKLVVDLEE